MNAHSRLTKLSNEISKCTRCDDARIKVDHVAPMERGSGSEVLVIGIEPGNSEVKEAKAFIGPAGINLMKWLKRIGLGNSREEILQRCYLTSLCKCKVGKDGDRKKVVRHCYQFLEEQIDIVQPKVCITLGKEPYENLFNEKTSLDNIVGKTFLESQITLHTILPTNCIIIPFPHPSPLSRWLNDEKNTLKLKAAIHKVKEVLGK